MNWQIEFGPRAQRALKKLDRQTAARLVAYLETTAGTGEPRSRCKALVGELAGFWRYRVGDWRIVARLKDEVVTIYVVRIGHRREVYGRS